MLIISKFKDYYDGVINTVGIDKTIIYKRDTISYDRKSRLKEFGIFDYTNFLYSDKKYIGINRLILKSEYKKIYNNVSYFIVGFCGKLYIGFKLYKNIDKLNSEIKITYDLEFIKNILKYNIDDNINHILNHDTYNIFLKHNSPIFIYDEGFVVINPSLNKYEFFKVFNAFQTFQEIQMYIGGVLCNNEDKIIEISNKDKIVQHGFDLKTSFRKQKKYEN